MPGGYDGVEIEYVSPSTNKKTYIRYRIASTGIVKEAAKNPLKISLNGSRNEYQANDRALVEVNKLVHSRGKMSCKTLADGQYVSVGDMVRCRTLTTLISSQAMLCAGQGMTLTQARRSHLAGRCSSPSLTALGTRQSAIPRQ